ncbi:phytase [Luteimonas wenzhouensis]|uniref:Phytase n=1 Tax=Luteimonas wenzhouensis TaxID=2599615 RepID=A0A5C5U036_9GAMM|nr:phytase [Luteimonas wenzhouensis]TWT19861.1 phytase [Luteimonas wenzhouensis]
MKNRLCTGYALALAACWLASPAAHAGDAASQQAATVSAASSTTAPASSKIGGAALILAADGRGQPRIVAATALGGLELYALDGKRLGATPAGEAAAVDVAYGVPLGKGTATVVAALDGSSHSLRLFRFADDRLDEVGARPIALGFAAEGLCLYRHPFDGALHVFVVGDGGEIDQLAVYATADGMLDARQVRRIGVPSPLVQCAVDAAAGHVYASEEEVGIWRFNADPEAEIAAVLVDSPRGGHIDEEVGGLAIHDGGPGSRWLIASNASAGTLNVYDLERDAAFVASAAVAARDGSRVDEPGLLHATSVAVGRRYPHGVLLVADEDGPDVKSIAIEALAAAIGASPGRAPAARAGAPAVPAVTALAETAPVASYGDAADDPAIWAHPTQPGRSLIVATDKKAGLYVYDMQGRVKQFLPDGKMNNVDLRDGFRLGGDTVTLVAASNRTDKTIALYRLDPEAGLVEVADGPQPTGMLDPYGLCMYRSARSGETYVFVNGDDTVMRQWRLVDAGNGRVRTELVRELAFDSQTEGCVADDETGVLYVGEEDVALWKLSAEPNGGDDKVAVDRIEANPALKDDIEGMGLYDLGDGRGYIVVSSQGNDTYAVYRREGAQEYLGSFRVVADPARGIDGISETDGLEVSSRNLGPGLEHGAMVAQDGRNVMPVENQNYKIVSWKAIADALGLEVRDP